MKKNRINETPKTYKKIKIHSIEQATRKNQS